MRSERMPRAPKDHRENRRTDRHADFAQLKRLGLVRSKNGNKIVRIDEPHTDFTPHDRDQLFQAYCLFDTANPSDKERRTWIVREAAKIINKRTGKSMSPSRARRIVGQGCGEWDTDNPMWWRGVSISDAAS